MSVSFNPCKQWTAGYTWLSATIVNRVQDLSFYANKQSDLGVGESRGTFPKDMCPHHIKSIIIKKRNTSSMDKDIYVGFGQKQTNKKT